MAARQANPFLTVKPDLCYVRLEFKGSGSNKFYEIIISKSVGNTGRQPDYVLTTQWGPIGGKKPQSKTYTQSIPLLSALWKEAEIIFSKKVGKGYKIVAAKFGVDNAKDAEALAAQLEERKVGNRFFHLV